MADAVGAHGRLRIGDIGCGLTRRALDSLESGAKIWLTVENKPVLFVRQADDQDGSGKYLVPVGGEISHWHALAGGAPVLVEIEFEGRPELAVTANRS